MPYRRIIFVPPVFATALLVALPVFFITIIVLNRQVGEIERSGIQVSSLFISREEHKVYLNNMEFAPAPAVIETLAVLAKARMDENFLSGSQIEAVISGRNAPDCDEASGPHPDSDGQRTPDQEYRPQWLYAVHRQGRDSDDLASAAASD